LLYSAQGSIHRSQGIVEPGSPTERDVTNPLKEAHVMAKDPKDPDEGDGEAHPPDPEGAGDLEQDRRAAHDRLTALRSSAA
jgi:hypothetical protein